jgi:hypothetical protein
LAVLWFLIITPIAVVFVFKHGFAFALCFFGTASVPCIAVAGVRWGVVAGDNQQKVGVPLVGLLMLAFAYWLSTYVSVTVFGLRISGLILMIISSIIGLIGVPLAWGGSVSGRR